MSSEHNSCGFWAAKKVQAELKPLGLKGLIAFVGHTSSGWGNCSMCFPQKGRVVGLGGSVGGYSAHHHSSTEVDVSNVSNNNNNTST